MILLLKKKIVSDNRLLYNLRFLFTGGRLVERTAESNFLKLKQAIVMSRIKCY